MAVYEPTGLTSREREEFAAIRARRPELTSLFFPAHPPGARSYCPGAITIVRVDQIVSIAGGRSIEEFTA